MNDAGTFEPTLTIIEPRSGWQIINLRELREYRDLFYLLVWRDINGQPAGALPGRLIRGAQPAPAGA